MTEGYSDMYRCFLSGAKLCWFRNASSRWILRWRYTGYGEDYYHSDLSGGSGAMSVVFLYKWAIVE